MAHTFRVAIVLIVTFVAPQTALAASGDEDPSFTPFAAQFAGPGGHEVTTDMVVQPDGRVVVFELQLRDS